MKRIALTVLVIGLASVAVSNGALPAPVTLDGVGGVVPGMTVRATAQVWGVTLVPRGGVTQGCAIAAVRKGSLHGSALFENGRFGAVWFDRGASTPSGIRIGSTRAQLVHAYGSRLHFVHNAYVHSAWYAFLTRRSSPHWRIRFDVAPNRRVNQIGFGGRAVAYEEGCA